MGGCLKKFVGIGGEKLYTDDKKALQDLWESISILSTFCVNSFRVVILFPTSVCPTSSQGVPSVCSRFVLGVH